MLLQFILSFLHLIDQCLIIGWCFYNIRVWEKRLERFDFKYFQFLKITHSFPIRKVDAFLVSFPVIFIYNILLCFWSSASPSLELPLFYCQKINTFFLLSKYFSKHFVNVFIVCAKLHVFGVNFCGAKKWRTLHIAPHTFLYEKNKSSKNPVLKKWEILTWVLSSRHPEIFSDSYENTRNGASIYFWLKKVSEKDAFLEMLCDVSEKVLEIASICCVGSLHRKWSFPLKIYSVSVTKSAGNCGFGHIYCRNPE